MGFTGCQYSSGTEGYSDSLEKAIVMSLITGIAENE